MLFINHTSNSQAAKDYFKQELAQAAYYMKDGQQVAGQWHGLGAKLLGLEGQVSQDAFYRLCDNENPNTGTRLTQRNKASRRVCYDVTLDCPKSVTLAYELGGDERILTAFKEAGDETIAEIERSIAVRVRKDGQNGSRVTGNAIVASFLHRTTRPLDNGIPDPQLHQHYVFANATYQVEDQRWAAAEFGAIKKDAVMYQSAFHLRLSGKLKSLGYAVERDGKSFRLVGIDETLTDKFSRRALLIEAEAQRRNITDAKRKAELGRQTRNSKNADLTIPQLREEWSKRLTDDDGASLHAAKNQWQRPQLTAQQAADYAVEHSFERASVVRENQLLAEAYMHGIGSASVEEIRAAVERADLIRKEIDGVRYVTTKQVYREEAEMVGFVRETRGKFKRLSTNGLPDGAGLTDEQHAAAMHILSSRDQVIGLRGGAGTGKTRMMQATVAAIEQNGHKVYTFAPSSEASRGVLRSEGFANADTVERLLTDDNLRKQVKGQVVWIDEAGLLSVKDTSRLFALAKEKQFRVVLAGDQRQHSGVGRGDALRIIERESGLPFAQLNQVKRQTETRYREAVQAISEGDARAKDARFGNRLEEGIATLDGLGAIRELEGEERNKQLANDYLDAVSEKRRDGSSKTALVVAPTHREGDQVTAQIREGLRERGKLAQSGRTVSALEGTNWTIAQRKDAKLYRKGLVIQFHQHVKHFKRGEKVEVLGERDGIVTVRRDNGKEAALKLADAERFQVYRREGLELAAGDVVRITQNGYSTETTRTGKLAKARLNNGAIYQVEGFTRNGDIRFTNGFIVPKSYGHLTYGYSITSHAAQGKTVDVVCIAMSHDALAAASREQFYVSVSRGRESVRIYTDDKEAMLEAVRTSGQRLSATELLEGQAPGVRAKPSQKLRQAVVRNYQVLREKGRDMIVPRPGKDNSHDRST